MSKLKYFSTFTGIGGFELGIGDKAECVGYSEIDKYAIQIFNKHFNYKNYGDITKIQPESLPDFDLLLEAFPASRLVLRENEVDLKTREARSFLKSQGLLNKNSHAFYCLRTSKGFYLTTKELRSTQSSPRLMSWGMTVNGKCLTARISESPKTGKECSLSDILEEQVDQKYFLSEEQTAKILSK
jgi:hypothetical protein